jgi:hypothetical protein
MENKDNKEFKSSYTKGQRVFALVAAVLLVGMYIVTLVAGITTSPAAPQLFKMSLGASILLPIMFWLYIRFWKMFADGNDEKKGKS